MGHGAATTTALRCHKNARFAVHTHHAHGYKNTTPRNPFLVFQLCLLNTFFRTRVNEMEIDSDHDDGQFAVVRVFPENDTTHGRNLERGDVGGTIATAARAIASHPSLLPLQSPMWDGRNRERADTSCGGSASS
jgi:hypothetical protein